MRNISFVNIFLHRGFLFAALDPGIAEVDWYLFFFFFSCWIEWDGDRREANSTWPGLVHKAGHQLHHQAPPSVQGPAGG